LRPGSGRALTEPRLLAHVHAEIGAPAVAAAPTARQVSLNVPIDAAGVDSCLTVDKNASEGVTWVHPRRVLDPYFHV
jgi:hypothetical protein